MKLSLSSKFGAKLSLPCPFFSRKHAFNHSVLAALCTEAINVLKPHAFKIPTFFFFFSLSSAQVGFFFF
jgi:hypothetical protein